jgi:hypothetical protein
MAQQIAAEPKPFTAREINEFAGNSNIWVTVLLPRESPGNKTLSMRFKRALTSAEEKLRSKPLTTETMRRIIAPMAEMAGRLDNEAQERTLALFCSPEELRYFWMPDETVGAVIAAKNIYIRPFLKNIDGERLFYILALSQKDVRLLRCTEHTSEEVDVKDAFYRDLHDFLTIAKPDHVLDNRVTAGPSMGAGPGVMFGTNTEAEGKGEYLHHFFKQVNDGVIGLLRGQEKTPLVLCGVDEVLAVYRSVNTWENTPEEGVRGAPNGLRGGEMHARAIEVLQRAKDKDLGNSLTQHDRQAGEVAQAGVDALVQFAYEGRILHLFAAEQASVLGWFDEGQFRARAHQAERPGDEDLINAAAVQTIVHSGRVHVMPQALVPGNRPMACIARY